MLNDLDLSFDDLAGKKVVDLGSGTQIIERAAALKGAGEVISVDKRDYVLSKRPEVKNGLVADIRKGIPQIPDNSIDLLISRAGPPTIKAVSKNKEDVDSSVAEILRMLKFEGEARISPLTFNFIEEKNERYQELIKKIYHDKQELTDSEKEEFAIIKKSIGEESLKYLQEKGVSVTARESKTMDWPYGIIKK
jgi:ubiquinone/menaquinone biosynthesis C-methylase UbiE